METARALFLGVSALAVAMTAAAAEVSRDLKRTGVRLGHFPDPSGRVTEESVDDRFVPGQPFWIDLDLPTATPLAATNLCFVWRAADGEVLSRALATTPPGVERLLLAAPDTSRWRGVEFRLDVLAPGPEIRGCGGPTVATARFALTVLPTAGPGGEPEDALSAFPWPPPRPTGRHLLARERLADAAAPARFGDVAQRLLGALDECGYHDRSFYGVPGGFALATRLEQIEPDGTPKPEPQRWSKAVPAKEVFDLGSFLDALFEAPEGHYRVIVFVARAGAVPTSTEEADRETADAWALGGDLVLPPALAALPWTDRHHVTVLVYQYEITGFHGQPMHPRDPPPARSQLDKSGLLAALTR